MKWIAQLIAGTFALAYRCWYQFLLLGMGRRRALTSVTEEVGRFPGWAGMYVRRAFYKSVLAHVGEDVYVGFMSLISKHETRLGDRVYIGRFCVIGLCDIESDVMLADGVQILSGRHQHGRESTDSQTLRDNDQQYEMVTIGRGAWIGAGAIVMADVGAGAMVGAGAVVSKPIEPGARVGGVPARPLGQSRDAKAYT